MESSTAGQGQAPSSTPGSPGDEHQARLDETVAGGTIAAATEDALLAFFLGNAPAPNSNTMDTFTVDLGDGRMWECDLRAIEWAEYREAQDLATSASTGVTDIYTQASYVVARATTRPLLGRMLTQIRAAADTDEAKAKAPRDGADLLRRAFAKQSGSLLVLQRHVLRISRLMEEDGGGVKLKEVEAGKPSS